MHFGQGMGAPLVACGAAVAALRQSGPSLGHHEPILDPLGSSWTWDAGEMMINGPGWKARSSLGRTPSVRKKPQPKNGATQIYL